MTIKDCFKRMRKKAKNIFYKHRIMVLILAVSFGSYSAYLITSKDKIKIFNATLEKDSKIKTSLTLIVLSLPVAFCLWLFKTHDTKESIQGTKESTQTGALYNALSMLTSEKIQTRAIGFRQLMYLRNEEKVFQIQIDQSTRGIDLGEANLGGAHLEGAHLEKANLGGANLEKAHLQLAHLEKANLRWANLEGANLGGAHLEGANLGGAHLEGANLGGAHLEGANLGGANLRGANLGGANLEKANLRGANLEGAYLEGAYLEGANLEGANLGGAHLKGANLKGAFYNDQNTTFPPNLDLQEAGMIETDKIKVD